MKRGLLFDSNETLNKVEGNTLNTLNEIPKKYKDINLKAIYDKIYEDKEIIEIYKEVEEYERKNGGRAYHNFEHIKNVNTIVEKILIELNYDKNTIYEAKIACLLHDTGAVEGKENHAYKSYEFAKKYLEKSHIEFSNIDLVLEAIKIHSDGFETNNIIALTLILADKLDIKKTRISEEGKKVEGNRQYSHIEDIILQIEDGTLKINFITDGNIDLEELNNYYFTKKVFKAIKSFSDKLNMNYIVLLDNKVWNI